MLQSKTTEELKQEAANIERNLKFMEMGDFIPWSKYNALESELKDIEKEIKSRG